MPPPLNLAIAGQGCRIHCADPDFRTVIAERYAPFQVPDRGAPPDLEVRVAVRAAPVRAAWQPTFVTHPGQNPPPTPPDYVPERDGPLPDYEVTTTADGLRVAAEDTLRAELHRSTRQGWIIQTPTIYLFHTALRQFLAYLLPWPGGCLLHAAGVVLGGRAVGLFGVSGSGKSTLARLAPGPVLTDESLALLPTAPGWTAYATPFWGDYNAGPPAVPVAPLAGLFRLVQAPLDRATRLPWHQAVREISASLMYRLIDPAYEAALLRQACALAAAIPCFQLEFRPTAAVWPVVKQALAGG